MTHLLRRAFPALTLLCLLCASAMLAVALNSLLDVWMQPPLPSWAGRVRVTPPRRQEPPTPLSLVTLRRQLGFPQTPRRDSLPAPTDPRAVPTALNLRLLGTMRGAPPAPSFASVFDTPTQRTHSLWLGEDFRGARVVAIERTRVLLWREGQLEAIEPQSAPASSAPAALSPLVAPSSIRQLGPEAYEISRQEVADTLANLNQVALQARVVPAFRDGVAQGFKLFSVRPGSLYTQLGLRNGDILRRINGLSLTSVEQALEAYTRLRDASRIELEVERDGQVLHPTYRVRD